MSRSCGRRLADAERRSTCIYAARISAVARIYCYGSAPDWRRRAKAVKSWSEKASQARTMAKAVKSWSEKVARALVMAKAVKSWQLIRVQGSPPPQAWETGDFARATDGRPLPRACGEMGAKTAAGPGGAGGARLGCRRGCWAREARAASVECGVQYWRQWDRRACSTDGTHGNGWAVPKSPVRLDGNMRPSKENPWQRPSSRT